MSIGVKFGVNVLKLLFIIELLLQLVSLGRYLYYKYQDNLYLKRQISENWYLRNSKNRWRFEESAWIYADYHPLLGWLPRPMQKEHVHITQERIRETMFNSHGYLENETQVFMFGGSTLWGVYTSDNETISSLLAKNLNTASHIYSVTNFGQIAFNSNQELVYLTQVLKEGKKPSIIIFYDGCNDLFFDLKHGLSTYSVFYEEGIKFKMGNMWQFFQRESPTNLSLFNSDLLMLIKNYSPKYIKLYYYTQKIIENLLGKTTKSEINLQVPQIENDTFVDRVIGNYEQNVKVIDALSQTYGFKYILVWQPLLFTKKIRTNDEKRINHYNPNNPELMYILITDRIKKTHLKNFYDLTAIFDNEQESIFIDECHVTPEGNEIISKNLEEILKEKL